MPVIYFDLVQPGTLGPEGIVDAYEQIMTIPDPIQRNTAVRIEWLAVCEENGIPSYSDEACALRIFMETVAECLDCRETEH